MSNEIIIRITVPEGITPVVDYSTGAQPAAAGGTSSPSAPQCPVHGPMFHKTGTSKNGKPWAGFFCTVDGCSTKPVWT